MYMAIEITIPMVTKNADQADVLHAFPIATFKRKEQVLCCFAYCCIREINFPSGLVCFNGWFLDEEG
jgi:hypothetical protein